MNIPDKAALVSGINCNGMYVKDAVVLLEATNFAGKAGWRAYSFSGVAGAADLEERRAVLRLLLDQLLFKGVKSIKIRAII